MYRKDSIIIEEWLKSSNKALLVTGARQIGKTWLIREEIAQSGYTKFEINFIDQPDLVDYLNAKMSADEFLMKLKMIMPEDCKPQETIVFFDEIQKCPEIVTKIKFLVEEGSFKYVMSGSLLGVELKGIASVPVGYLTVLRMYPMDFEEFLWAIGDKITVDTIKLLIKNKKPAGNALHRNLMRIFRLYMLVGGMPQAVETYIQQNNLQAVDEVKREIVDLYEEDFVKVDGTGLAGDIYDAIPANLSSNASRYVLSNAREGTRVEQVRELIPDMLSSHTVNIAYHANNPGVGMALEKDAGRYKLFLSDVGLFVTLVFKDKSYTENVIYNKLLSDKLDTNLGYVYENVVAQMLIVKGNNLFYYTMESETSNHLYEIDFLISKGDKICPMEVKSGNYRTHKSLDVFCDKFSRRIRDKYVVHTKDYKRENGIHYIPVYMVPFL